MSLSQTKNMKPQKKILGLFVTALALSANTAQATGWQMPTNPGSLPEDFMGSLGNITTWLLELAAALAVLAIIYAGVVYTASSGDQERVESAKKSIKYAIMGLAMAGIAYAIVNVIITKILVA